MNKPESAIVLRHYNDLLPFVDGFASGTINLLVLLGSPGLGKSRIVRGCVNADNSCWIDGHASAFRLYCELYHRLDLPVVIDDVDSLYADRNAVRLLKALCNTEATKQVAWHTAAKQLEDEGIPRSFATTSNVCLIANRWRTLNENVEALEDRGIVACFAPSAREVHKYIVDGGWLHDADILTFVSQHLDLISRPSLRYYVTAGQLKRAGMDWRSILLEQWHADKGIVLASRVLRDDSLPTMTAKANAFHQLGGGSRATFYRRVKTLRH